MQKIRIQKEFFSKAPKQERNEWENALKKIVLHQPDKKILFPGYCMVCKKEVNFCIDNQWASSENDVNFRESVLCPSCNLNNRMRCMVTLMEENADFSKHYVYLYEQKTFFYQYLSTRIPHLTGSEYLGEDAIPGFVNKEGIRHEDAMNLSFEDETFDLLVSQDVFEHVADIHKTLSEAYRVLKSADIETNSSSGGKLLISVPFFFNNSTTEKRAEITNGELHHIKSPVYHGNPIDENGSLVFYDYGWDLLVWMKEVGFRDVYFIESYSVNRGNIGNNSNYFLVAEK